MRATDRDDDGARARRRRRATIAGPRGGAAPRSSTSGRRRPRSISRRGRTPTRAVARRPSRRRLPRLAHRGPVSGVGARTTIARLPQRRTVSRIATGAAEEQPVWCGRDRPQRARRVEPARRAAASSPRRLSTTTGSTPPAGPRSRGSGRRSRSRSRPSRRRRPHRSATRLAPTTRQIGTRRLSGPS